MATKEDKKICFVISPIGDGDSETRKRSDKVLKHIITPSVELLGYKVIRADKISTPGIITTQIIQHIVDSPLVIADLTERNPNVFYELALRHAIRKPLVQLIQKGEAIPFDIAATRIIQFDIHDLDSVESAKTEILSQIKTMEESKNDIDNPISVSLDLKVLKQSGNPEQRSLADIVEAIEKLPSLLERRLDSDSRRKRKYHPIMFEELMHMENAMGNTNMGFLMMVSLFKDDLPWLYEVGLETYKGLKSAKSVAEKRKLIESFEKALEFMRHPMMREFYGKSEEMYMFNKAVEHFLHRFLDRYIEDSKSK